MKFTQWVLIHLVPLVAGHTASRINLSFSCILSQYKLLHKKAASKWHPSKRKCRLKWHLAVYSLYVEILNGVHSLHIILTLLFPPLPLNSGGQWSLAIRWSSLHPTNKVLSTQCLHLRFLSNLVHKTLWCICASCVATTSLQSVLTELCPFIICTWKITLSIQLHYSFLLISFGLST